MSEKKASQSQQDAWSPWQQAAEAQVARIQAFYDQMARVETEGADRARQAIDEMARLGREAIDHSARLAAEWRRLSLEAVNRSAELAGRMAI